MSYRWILIKDKLENVKLFRSTSPLTQPSRSQITGLLFVAKCFLLELTYIQKLSWSKSTVKGHISFTTTKAMWGQPYGEALCWLSLIYLTITWKSFVISALLFCCCYIVLLGFFIRAWISHANQLLSSNNFLTMKLL